MVSTIVAVATIFLYKNRMLQIRMTIFNKMCIRDRYYAFKNEFPESKYLKEAEKIFNESQKVIKD